MKAIVVSHLSKSRIFAACAALLGMILLPATTAAAEEKALNVYNWSLYIGKETLEKFTRETGIRVNYDVYDDNMTLDAKLMASRTGYDVVFPSALPYFARQLKAGIFRKLDMRLIPNAKGLDSGIMATLAEVDPGNQHAVPYMWGATGFGYDVEKVAKLFPQAPTKSWAMIFDPATLARLKGCGIAMFDTAPEVILAMRAYLGKDPHAQTLDDLADTMAALEPLRPFYRYFHNVKQVQDLANGDICVGIGYAGGIAQARAMAATGQRGRKIAVVIPEEGAMVNIDVMAIPADAPHPEDAHAFINFILRPDIIAEISNETWFANAVPAAQPLVSPDLRDDPAIYPPPQVRAKLFAAPPPASQEYERVRTRAWAKFRSGRR